MRSQKSSNKSAILEMESITKMFPLHEISLTGVTSSFLALHQIDLRIEAGEIVGLIGPNGAGKSTLMRIVSRILTPTMGTVRTEGRITSLLELGTGFHPELSGRENVLVNGTLLGMSQKEISDRIAEIAEFSEVGDYFDRPVKTYSSGMQRRLAISVALHVSPNFVVIDEALAVGDGHFKHKCTQKLKENLRSGIAALISSHDLGLVNRICTRVVLLEKGRVTAMGDPTEICSRYLATYSDEALGEMAA